MDSSLLNGEVPINANNLSDSDKRELQQSIQAEAEKAKIQDSVHNLTDICFKKCITGKISSGKLSSSEESCAQNCVQRFLDGNLVILKHLEQMNTGGGNSA